MKITLEENSGVWMVSQEDGDSVWPTTEYETKRLAVSRILQLLDLGPVGPQLHPERVCISNEF